MILLWLSMVLAVAGQWAPPRRLAAVVDGRGVWLLEGGEAARLVTDPPDSDVDVRLVDGTPVPVFGDGEGLLVAAAAVGRELQVFADPDVHVRVSLLERDDADGRWLTYEREVMRWIGGDSPGLIGLPPSGSARLAASLRLRAAALSDISVELLGAMRDLSLARPIGGGAHAFEAPIERISSPEAPLEVVVVGPGLVTWVAQPQDEGFFRFDVRVSLDGGPARRVALAGTGTARRAERMFVPPGVHTLSLGSDEIPVAFTVLRRRIQPPLLGSWPRDVGYSAGLAEAERRYLSRERGAGEMFRFHKDKAGPVGELARARMVELTADTALKEQLIGTVSDWSADGIEVLCDAVLRNPDGLEPSLVQAIALQAKDPDLKALATWMNDLGGRRPRGQALLVGAVSAVPMDPHVARAAVRTGSIGTRWSRLWPTVSAGPGLLLRTPEGPGIPRVAIDGEAHLFMPQLLGERWPTVSLTTDGPAVFDLDGLHYTVPYTADLTIALPPGGSTLDVQEGTVFAMNPTLVEGGRPVYEWMYAELPATFELPDPGVPVEIALTAERAGEVTVAFDDGRVAVFDTGAGRVVAGAWARGFTVQGSPGSRVAAMMRIPVAADRGRLQDELAGPDSVEAAIAQIDVATRGVDRGYIGDRLPRAEALAILGRVTDARRDLAMAEDDPDLTRAVARLRAHIARQNPSAPEPGPVSVEAALAASGIDAGTAPRTPAEEAVWLRDLAERHPDRRPLVRIAIDRSLAVGDTAEAARLAWLTQELGRMDRMAGVTPWRAVGRADTRTGLVPVVQSVEPNPAPPLWARIDNALLASPWSEVETVALREGESDLVQLPASRLKAELFCRDMRLARRPCVVQVRVGNRTRVVQVRDGQVEPITLVDGLYGQHVVEVGGPAQDQMLIVRLSADGEVQPPTVERLALQLGSAPVRMTIAGDALLRVQALDGDVDVTVDGESVPMLLRDNTRTLWLDGAGAHVVSLRGRGRALVSRGVPRVPPGPPEPPPAEPLDAHAAYDVSELLSRHAPAAPPELPEVGNFGSLRVGAGILRDLDGRNNDPYTATEIGAEYLRAGDVGWVRAGPWVRSPLGAAGLLGDTGLGWGSGLVGIRGEAGLAGAGAASSWQVTLRARQDVRLSPRWRFRAEGRAFAGRWSLPPADPVDARAWSLYRLTHPQGVALLPSVIWRPTRDLRLQGGLTAFTNPDLTLDTVGIDADADWLVARYTLIKLDLGVRRALLDSERDEPEWRPLIGLGLDHAPWVHRNHRLQISPRLFITQVPVMLEGRLTVSWMFSPGRGLRDLAPDSETFRIARGALP
ncbi:MAG: hypothetical protein ACI8PZ_002983 [Myxococcota bacterium]|jgi:hypothetical protein